MYKLFILGMGHLMLTREAIIAAYDLSNAKPLDAGRKCYFPSSKGPRTRIVRYMPDDIAERIQQRFGK
jgi:hypothetical protein